jgi:hypothetical protein
LGEEQKRWPVLSIEELDIGGISVSSVHVAVSIYLCQVRTGPLCVGATLIVPGWGLSAAHELQART